VRFHLNDADLARHAAIGLRGALKRRGHPRTHTKRLASVAAMLGYTNWSELLVHCPSTQPVSAFDEELDHDALTERLRYQAEALARAAHVPRLVAVEVIDEVRPTSVAGRLIMTDGPDVEDIVLERLVPGRPEQVFAAFVHGVTTWWPASFTFALAELDTITLEPRQGGRWYETSTAGDDIDWGVVTACDPPQRLALTFQLSATRTVVSREHASDVSFDFLEREHGCALQMTHSHLHRHGADAATIRTNMASEHGWPFILNGFCRHYGEAPPTNQQKART
jgi:uncharacterized protein YndB with AHSA1/START domain